MGQDVWGSVDREIRENRRQDAIKRKAQWAKDHPRTTAITTGWGKALKKEGKALGGTLAKECNSTVDTFASELGKLFSFR